MKHFTKEAATAVMTALVLGALLITDISATVLSNSNRFTTNAEQMPAVPAVGTADTLPPDSDPVDIPPADTVTDNRNDNNGTPYNLVKQISLDKTLIHLNKGDKRTLTPAAVYKRSDSELPQEPLVWKSSNTQIAAVNKKGVVTGKKNGTAYITVTSKYSGKKAKCKVVVQKTKYIAFTFDDGPGIYTDKLLDKLSKNHCQATFFVVGNRVGNYKDELLREQALGMEIGNHSYSHKDLTTLSADALKAEIAKCSKAVKKVTGQNPTLLRPPYGSHNKSVRKASELPVIMWSVDTLDWKYRDSTYVKDYILKHAGNGQIILLHDIHKTSVNGFLKALPTLRERGYELVTISELYEIHGIEMKDGSVYNGIH